MKVFIIGLPKSGRTTIAKFIAKANNWQYLEAYSWTRSNFRKPREGEHLHQFEDEFQQHVTKHRLLSPDVVSYLIHDAMKLHNECDHFVIDDIISPRDFISLFDYRQDVVIFLNRTNNDHEYRDHENIAVSVIRDYCFWLSSAGLITKDRWLEYNFKIPGEESDYIKTMGAQNSVFIVKSFSKMADHMVSKLVEITDAISK